MELLGSNINSNSNSNSNNENTFYSNENEINNDNKEKIEEESSDTFFKLKSLLDEKKINFKLIEVQKIKKNKLKDFYFIHIA